MKVFLKYEISSSLQDNKKSETFFPIQTVDK